jgi:hypothetical protein
MVRCLAMNVLLLSALAPAEMCLPSHCLAMGLHLTVCSCSWHNSCFCQLEQQMQTCIHGVLFSVVHKVTIKGELLMLVILLPFGSSIYWPLKHICEGAPPDMNIL